MELAGDIDLLMIDRKKRVKTMKLKELLPFPFSHRNLERTRKKK
jgi:cytidine deaminase